MFRKALHYPGTSVVLSTVAGILTANTAYHIGQAREVVPQDDANQNAISATWHTTTSLSRTMLKIHNPSIRPFRMAMVHCVHKLANPQPCLRSNSQPDGEWTSGSTIDRLLPCVSRRACCPYRHIQNHDDNILLQQAQHECHSKPYLTRPTD